MRNHTSDHKKPKTAATPHAGHARISMVRCLLRVTRASASFGTRPRPQATVSGGLDGELTAAPTRGAGAMYPVWWRRVRNEEGMKVEGRRLADKIYKQSAQHDREAHCQQPPAPSRCALAVHSLKETSVATIPVIQHSATPITHFRAVARCVLPPRRAARRSIQILSMRFRVKLSKSSATRGRCSRIN